MNIIYIKHQILDIYKALGCLIRRGSIRFEKKSLLKVNALLLSAALKSETSVFFSMLRDFMVSHSSLDFLVNSESLSSENTRLSCC